MRRPVQAQAWADQGADSLCQWALPEYQEKACLAAVVLQCSAELLLGGQQDFAVAVRKEQAVHLEAAVAWAQFPAVADHLPAAVGLASCWVSSAPAVPIAATAWV